MITAPGRYTGIWMEAIEPEPRKHLKAFDIGKNMGCFKFAKWLWLSPLVPGTFYMRN